jgi:PKD repeat protein
MLLALIYSACQNDTGNITLNPPPVISAMAPDSVIRGQTDVEGRITGQNLATTTAVDLGPGIAVSNLKVVDANQITFLFSVSRTTGDGPRDVTVTTATGQVSARVLTVGKQQAPFARFSIQAEDNWKGSEVKLNAEASSADTKIVGYRWDFGDGNKAGGMLITHRYNRAGNFDITLDVIDNRGALGSTTKSIRILDNYAPIARFTMDGVKQTGKPITFNADGSSDKDGASLTYLWNFGDGHKGDGKRVTHTYDSGRTFNVTLTVRDKKGASDSTARSLEIQKPVEHNPPPTGGGGGTCAYNVYFQNWFTVRAVNGLTITADVQVKNCPGHGEIRRRATGIQEFVGDIVRISGYNITFDPVSLPLSTRPQVGERLYVIWKP